MGGFTSIGKIDYIEFITTTKLPTPISTHSNIANRRGLKPTDLIADRDKLAPMRNRVKTSPFLAIQINDEVNSWGRLQNVLIIMANINRNINHGIEILLDLSRNNNIVINDNGIIHSARVSFIKVAVCNASEPKDSPAPTTDEVSCIAIAAQVPNCC